MAYVTSAPTFAAAEVVTAAKMNALADGIQAAWTAWTPTWTATSNPALGNGSFSGTTYMRVGKTIHFQIKLVMGSTTTYGTGGWKLTLPVAPVNTSVHVDVVYIDNSVGAPYRGTNFSASGSTIDLLVDISTAGGALSGVTSTSPFTWAVNDRVEAWGTYQAA